MDQVPQEASSNQLAQPGETICTLHSRGMQKTCVQATLQERDHPLWRNRSLTFARAHKADDTYTSRQTILSANRRRRVAKACKFGAVNLAHFLLDGLIHGDRLVIGVPDLLATCVGMDYREGGGTNVLRQHYLLLYPIPVCCQPLQMTNVMHVLCAAQRPTELIMAVLVRRVE